MTLQLPTLGEESIDFTLLPQRRWSIHLVHHSHFDFGYTDQPVASYEPSVVISHFDELTVELAQRLIAAGQ